MREQLHELVNRPSVARNARGHSGSAPAKRAMRTREVVVHEVQRNGCLKVLKLFRESICQSGESAHGHAHGEIRPLDVAGGHAVQVGLPHDSPALNARHFVWRVAILWPALLTRSVLLDE